MSGEQYGTFKANTAQGIKGVRRQIFRVESIKAYNELENYFTKLWEMRGIKWTE